MPKINLTGRTFGRLLVLSFYPRPGKNPYWLCSCSCGKETVVRAECLRKGSIQSCGCLAKEVRKLNATTHDISRTLEYHAWRKMLKRCNDSKAKAYPLYGGKGIKVCESWSNCLNFLSDMGKMPFPKATIERINPIGNFEPSNCRWGHLKARKIKPILRHFPDITNQMFGKLTAINLHEKRGNSKAPLWLFKCLCGNNCIKSSSIIRKKREQSCGCPIELKKATKFLHGMSNSAEFRSWSNMKERCSNPKIKSYQSYGGRGITVCDSWKHSFINFFNDMGARPSDDHTIERINVNGNYEPSNCIWIHWYDQASNRRTNNIIEYNGKRLHITAWARELGVKYYQIKYLMNDKKLTFSEAVTELKHLGKTSYIINA